MFGGAYGDARMPNWPHWHRTHLPGIATTGLRRDKGGNALGQATFLPTFLLCHTRSFRLNSIPQLHTSRRFYMDKLSILHEDLWRKNRNRVHELSPICFDIICLSCRITCRYYWKKIATCSPSPMLFSLGLHYRMCKMTGVNVKRNAQTAITSWCVHRLRWICLSCRFICRYYWKKIATCSPSLMLFSLGLHYRMCKMTGVNVKRNAQTAITSWCVHRLRWNCNFG